MQSCQYIKGSLIKRLMAYSASPADNGRVKKVACVRRRSASTKTCSERSLLNFSCVSSDFTWPHSNGTVRTWFKAGVPKVKDGSPKRAPAIDL